MRKLAMWIFNNVPVGKFAPHILGYATGTTSWRRKFTTNKYNIALEDVRPVAVYTLRTQSAGF